MPGAGDDRWTPEQHAVFAQVARGGSAAIRAVAGAGKTTTLLEAATRAQAQDPNRRFLVLTYNRRLCDATAARLEGVGAGVLALTYHSAAARLFDVPVVTGGSYDACIDAACRSSSMSPRVAPFDTLFIDEAQDLNPLFLRFVQHLVELSAVKSVVLAGDERQTLYSYKDGDAKSTAEILLDPARFFPQRLAPFEDLRLSASFRVPRVVADFVNAELWQAGAQRIDSRASQSGDEGHATGSVRLLECTPSLFGAAEAVARHVAQSAADPGTTAVLGHSDNAKTPLREISNRLRALGVRIVAPDDQSEPGAGGAQASAVTVGTFHSTKGLEWDTVYVIGFDCYYHRATKAFEPHAMDPLYVACTRPRDRLFLVKCSRHGLPFQVRASAFGTPRQRLVGVQAPAGNLAHRPAMVTGTVPWSIIGDGRVARMLALSDAAVPLNTTCSSPRPCKQCSHDAPRTIDAASLTSSLPVAACDELLGWFGPFVQAGTSPALAGAPTDTTQPPLPQPLLDPCAAALLNRSSSIVVTELLATAHKGAAQKRSASLAALRLVREHWPQPPPQSGPEQDAALWWAGVTPERLGATLIAWDAVTRDSTALVCRATRGGVSCSQVADEAIATAQREAELVDQLETRRSQAQQRQATVEWGVRVEAVMPSPALVYPCCAGTGPATVTAIVDAVSDSAVYLFVQQLAQSQSQAPPGDKVLALACVLALATQRQVACVVDVRSGTAWEARNPKAANAQTANAVLAQAARASLGCSDPFAARMLQITDSERGARLKLLHAEERQRARLGLGRPEAMSCQKKRPRPTT